jgi:hypothetical protein
MEVITYKDDFFSKFPNAPRGIGKYSSYPTADLDTIYVIPYEKQKEFCTYWDGLEWDKPLGYWD